LKCTPLRAAQIDAVVRVGLAQATFWH
jgi:hypothetical protein